MGGAVLGLSAKKLNLFSTELRYLGNVLCRDGVKVDPTKISAIQSIDGRSINNITAVRSFLGMANYWRRFIKGFAEISAPITALTRAGADVAQESQAPAVQTAITALKESLCSAPILMLPRHDRQFILKTDASTSAIGAVLAQEADDGAERVVAYYGRRLTPSEQNWTITELELLAVLASTKHFRPYLWGRTFMFQFS